MEIFFFNVGKGFEKKKKRESPSMLVLNFSIMDAEWNNNKRGEERKKNSLSFSSIDADE